MSIDRKLDSLTNVFSDMDMVNDGVIRSEDRYALCLAFHYAKSSRLGQNVQWRLSQAGYNATVERVSVQMVRDGDKDLSQVWVYFYLNDE